MLAWPALAGRITSAIDWSAATYAEVCARHRWVIPPRLNIADISCARHADGSGRLALIEVGAGAERRFTFDELEQWSAALAAGLAERGIEPGDRVAVFLPQCAENPVAHLAALRMGAISVPLSPLFRGAALAHRLADSGSRAIITDADHLQHLAAVRAELPDLEIVITCDADAGALELSGCGAGSSPGVGGAKLGDLVDRDRPLAAPLDTSADDPAMLLYTSGTTGAAKGALHAHRFLPGRLSAFELTHRLEDRPSRGRPFFTPADWSWVAGLVDSVFTPWVFACPVVAWRRQRFDAAAMLDVIRRTRPRAMFLPPTALNLLGQVMAPDERVDVGSVHSAGEPLATATYHWAARTFGQMFDLYGMTEIGAIVGSSPLVPARPGAMGKPYPGHDVALVDDSGATMSGVGAGEIAVARDDPGMFLGYWGDAAATEARFVGDRLLTGDLARRDAEGYLWHLGRRDDVFNASGYRIGPTEVESALQSHAAVDRAAVVGAADRRRGTVVKAFIMLRPGAAASASLADELREKVRLEVAAYAYPRQLVFVHSLPLTVSGKVRRNRLRAGDADQRFGIDR